VTNQRNANRRRAITATGYANLEQHERLVTLTARHDYGRLDLLPAFRRLDAARGDLGGIRSRRAIWPRWRAMHRLLAERVP